MNGKIPDVILVGINTINRPRDYLPPLNGQPQSRMQKWTAKKFPQFGGTDNFLSFIKTEVFPYVAKHYSVTPHKTLIGHSNGAVLGLYSILTQPDLFDNILAISPAAWWSEAQIQDQLNALFKAKPQLDNNLYLTIAGEGRHYYSHALAWSSNLELNAVKDFKWQFKHLPNETHNSVIFPSIYQGLQTLYGEFMLDDIESIAKYGAVKDLIAYYQALGEKYRYDINLPQQALIELADLQFDNERPLEAMNTLQVFVKRYPESSHAHKNLADGYMKTQQYAKARDSYQKALVIVEKLNLPDPYIADAIRDMVKNAQSKLSL